MINSSGRVVETISGAPINGPWDMTRGGAGGVYFADDGTNTLNLLH